MPRKTPVPKVDMPTRVGVTGLTVKDGLREVRFNVRHEARKLVEAVSAATHRGHDAHHGPMALLGEPLNLAVRTAAHLLNHVDLAAVDLLAHDAAYRSMSVGLCPSGAYFDGPARSGSLGIFTTDHHWRYRHWLALTQRGDVFVHEQEIAAAGAQVVRALSTGAGASAADLPGEAAHRGQVSARLVQALLRQRIFSRPALSGNEEDAELAAWSALGGVTIVLAGDLAAHVASLQVPDQYASALRLADEIANADRQGWETALRHPAPTQALMRWFDFVLRHA